MPPNVIVILADDMGYGDIGAFGNPLVRTPNLDRLVAEGLALHQHYSGSPMCAPARAALLTGKYPHRTGAIDVPSNRGLDRIALGEITIADAFKAGGYRTGMIGKWHNGLHDMRYHPNARGFDEFAGFLNGGMDYWRWVLDYNGTPRRSDGRYLTDVFSTEASAFIRRHQHEPFFLYVAYNAPHIPLQAPGPLVKAYQDAGQVHDAVACLYAMIERMDAGIGQILDTLDDCELTDNTVVLFSSDNGPHMAGDMHRYNGHFAGSKGDVLEGGIRVPAILRWPDGLPAGQQCDALVHFCDWLPTFLDTAGLDAPAGIDGVDGLPVLRGEAEAGKIVRYWQWNRYTPVARCNGAMRDDTWKLYWPTIPGSHDKLAADAPPYIHGLTHAHALSDIDPAMPERQLPSPGTPRLFDLKTDPYEQDDRAADEPERLQSMIRAWDTWFDRMIDELSRIPDAGKAQYQFDRMEG